MENTLLRIIDRKGNIIWDDKFKIAYVHLDSFEKFAKKNNINIPLSTDENCALVLASMGFISILNIRVGYLSYLPETCSKEQIDYLEKELPFFEQNEKEKIIEFPIYSKEQLYYNHKNYRDLLIEEEIDILEGKKKNKDSITKLLRKELESQRLKLVEQKKL